MSLRRIPARTGNYHLDLRVPDPDRPGHLRRIIRSLGTPDRAEAMVRYHALAAELTSAAPRTDPTVTLHHLHQRILSYIGMELSPASLKNYSAAFDSLLSAIPPDTPIHAVTRTMIDSWRLAASQKMQASTLNQYTAKIQAAYNRAIDWGWAEKNPLYRLPLLKVAQKTSVQYFAPDQVAAILGALGHRKYGDAYAGAARLSVYAGLRVGEVVRLRAEHIQGDNLRVEMATKGRRFRTVPLSAPARTAARDRIDRGSEWLFPSPLEPETHMATRSAAHVFAHACAEVGIEHGHWHMLRHTFAARLLSAGVPIFTVSRWLGHATVAITEAHYGHLVPGSQDHLIELPPLE